MLENPEARAKLRRKLEIWPDDRKSPVTINQALELLDLVERLEKEVNWLADELIMSELKKCPICDCPQKAPDIPTEADSVVFWNGCRKCWLEAARKAVEQQNERK